MCVILDTNVAVSGLLWNGAPRHLLQAARARRLKLFTSSVLLLELADILERSKFTHKVIASDLSVTQLVVDFSALATVVHPHFVPSVIHEDPDDNHVLACAVAANAEQIVSGDRHLLRLGNYRGTAIVTASEALARLARANH